MQRREFFKAGAAAAAVGLSYTIAGAEEEAAQTGNQYQPIYAGRTGKFIPGWGDQAVEHITAYNPDFADKDLWIRKDNQCLATYRTGPNQKYPYLYPMVGPKSMVTLLTESSQPWPHHRGCFLGEDKVNGGNYWQQGRADGQILSQGVKVVSCDEKKIVWTDEGVWKKPDQDPIITDTRQYTIEWRCDDYYVLDLEYSRTMLVDVTCNSTNHGFFGVRVSQDICPDGGGELVSDEGVFRQANNEKKAHKWLAYYGARRFNPAITEGCAVFCAPAAAWKDWGVDGDCPWLVRDYGNISPLPYYIKGAEFPAGTVQKMNFRAVFFAGTAQDIDLNGLWNEIYG